MKKKLILVALASITVTTPILSREFDNPEDADAYYAKWRQTALELEEAIAKGKADDALLKNAVFRLSQHLQSEGGMDAGGIRGEYLFAVNGLKRAYQKAEISQEQAIRIQEEMVREKLSAIEKDVPNSIPWELYDVLPLFGVFPDYEAFPIFRECLQTKTENSRRNAMETYANIKGAEAIPLLREAIEKGYLSKKNRESLNNSLGHLVQTLEEENKTNDIKKLTAFLKERKHVEQMKEKGGN